MLANTSQQQSYDLAQVNLTSDRSILHGDEKNIKKKNEREEIFLLSY